MKNVLLLFVTICMLSCSGKNDNQNLADCNDLPRIVLGCSLGETSLPRAKKILKSKGLNLSDGVFDRCMCLTITTKVNFLGKQWDGAKLSFYDGSLIRAEFIVSSAYETFSEELSEHFEDSYCYKEDNNIYINNDKTSLRLTVYKESDDIAFSDLRITDFERNDLIPVDKDVIAHPF